MEYNRRDPRMGFGGGDADNSLIRRHRNEPQQPHLFDQDYEVEEEMVQPRVGVVEYPPVQLIDIEEPVPRPERVERPSRTRHRTSRRARSPSRERVLISVPCVIPTPRSNQRPIPGSQMISETEPDALVRQAGGSLDQSNSVELERSAPLEIVRFTLRLGWNAILYPYEFAKVLIQLGHEPLLPSSYTWPFINHRPHLYLPGVHRYVQHIHQVDGFYGLYRGLPARLVSSAIDYMLGDTLLHIFRLKPYRRSSESSCRPPRMKEFLYNLFRDTIRLVTAVALTHPFHVIMVRQMAQFVGRETIYEGLTGSLMTMVHNEGWLGLYAGVAPRFLSECLVLVVTSSVSHLCRRFMRLTRVQQQYNAVLIQMAASLLVYPLEVTGSCMACTGAPLVACEPPRMPLYNHWADCLSDLYARGGHNRGALLFWRTVPRIQMQRHQLEPPPRALLRGG